MHGMGLQASGLHGGTKESEFQVQLGSKLLPERAQASLTEQLSHFIQCVGKAPNVSKTEYFEGKHVLSADCRKVSALGAGLSTKSGELLNARLKYPTTVIDNNLPKEVTCYLVAESMLEISDAGVVVLEEKLKNKKE